MAAGTTSSLFRGVAVARRLTTRVASLGFVLLLITAGIPPAAAAGAGREPGDLPRWNRTTVHVVSELGSDWPVAAAAAGWDAASRLRLVTVARCPVREPSCVTVRWGRLPTGTLGKAATRKDGLGRFKSATVMINDRIAETYPYALKLLLVRHELGHTLGFNHSRKHDVMNEEISRSGAPLLGWYHVEALRELYGP